MQLVTHHMLGSMGLHAISRSSSQQPRLLSRTWEEAVLGSCSWRQELSEGAIHRHGDQPAHGGCQARLHVTVTRYNQCVCTDINLCTLVFVPKTPHEAPSSFITGYPAICNTQLGSVKYFAKISLNFATCDDPDPKKPQAKGLVPNLQYKIQMETLDTLSGHTRRVAQSTQCQG